MTDNLNRLPTSLVSFAVLPLLSSNDLLSLRVVSTRSYHLIHTSEESEEIWRQALVRDFSFDETRNDTVGAAGDGDGELHHMRTLRVTSSSGRPSERVPSESGRNEDRVSVFGHPAAEGVFTAPSSFASWKHWRKASLQYYAIPPSHYDAADAAEAFRERLGPPGHRNLHGPFFLRAAAMWSKIEGWLDGPSSGRVGQMIKSTLLEGTTYVEGKFRFVDGRTDERGLLACQAIHAFHGGQEEVPYPPSDSEEDISKLFWGLLGGYSAYNSVVCTRLLKGAVFGGLDFPGMNDMTDYIPIASSFYLDKKVFDLNVHTGQVYLRSGSSERIPAVTLETESSGSDSTMSPPYDSALVWMEELASRLQGGSICAGRIIPNEPISEGILLFPALRTPPLPCRTQGMACLTSYAVTRGVEVVASAIFTGEFLDRGMAFIYSIRIRLLTPGEEGYLPPSARGFDTCQLQSRHWQIYNQSEGSTEHVRGDGVIGLYPLLREGGYRNDSGYTATHLERPGEERLGAFKYQSCTGMVHGTFGGTLQFVPGEIRSPSDEPFNVVVAPFTLNPRPNFLF